jgi:hypothetical protein
MESPSDSVPIWLTAAVVVVLAILEAWLITAGQGHC